MRQYRLEEVATDANFNAEAYLAANPDVAQALEQGTQRSAHDHFRTFGKHEGRKLRGSASTIKEAKDRKLEAIQPLLRDDMPYKRTIECYDFLTDGLREQFNIVTTSAVSSNEYDGRAMDLIAKHIDGFVLDCGAGRRPVYFENVVNFEIVPYDTVDVVGVGEVLPFRDNSFSAVLSLAVLEHVKDPFRCAKEIIRVLKPGGELICCVPFLQPLHGYPHHYYNMTPQGLENLFDQSLAVDSVEVYESVLPIWSLTWILRSWSEGLTERTRKEFLNLKVSDLIEPAQNYIDRAFVKELSGEKNLELASACVLFAHKPEQEESPGPDWKLS